MAVKANELFKSIGEKFGLPAEVVAKISGNTALNVDVDDDVAKAFQDTTVFTEESAKANPTIRAAIRAEALNGVDADVKRLMGKHAIPDDIQAEILAGDKTSARLEKAFDKIAELEKKKAGASGQAKDSLEKEIEKLNAQVLSERAQYEGKLKAVQAERENDRVRFMEDSVYGQFEYGLPDVEKSVAMITARAVNEAKLREKGIVTKMTEDGTLALFNKDGQPYFENNTKYTVNDLYKKHLIESKLIKVSDGKGAPQQQQQNLAKPDLKVNDAGLSKQIAEGLKRDGFVS